MKHLKKSPGQPVFGSRPIPFCFLCGCIVFYLTTAAGAAVLHVPADYPTIRSAVEAASGGDTIRLASGTYSGEGNTELDLPDITLFIDSEHGPESCIIDCRRMTSFCSIPAMSLNIVTIDGLTVINGRCTGSSPGGAAIDVTDASPVIRNCIFRNNGELPCLLSGGVLHVHGGQLLIEHCRFEGNASGNRGGAVYMETGRLRVTDTEFECNVSQVGGAVAVDSVDLQINGCRFSGNVCTVQGGGLHTGGACIVSITGASFSDNGSGETEALRQSKGGAVCFGASATQEVYRLDQCSFESNHAGSGGAVWTGANNRLCMTDCVIESNAATGSGGGVYSDQSQEVVQTLQFWNSEFTANTAQTGGAVYQRGGTGYISACIFRGNHATEGGACHMIDFVTTRIENCLFESNNADSIAGAVFAQSNSELWIRYSSFVHNTAVLRGGAILTRWSRAVIGHDIMWINEPDQIYAYGYGPTVTSCLVEGGYEGSANIDSDPLFVTGPMGNYYLSQTAAGQAIDSPAVDAGTVTAGTASIRSPDGDVWMSAFTTRTDHITDTGILDLGYHYPETIPEPEPPCPEFGCLIEMPATMFHAGEACYCRLTVCNSTFDVIPDALVFVILEIVGQYFFAPGFSGLDAYRIDLPPDETVIDVIPVFTWPDSGCGAGTAAWYAAVTDPDITMILGAMDMFGFGWSEEAM